MKIDITRELYKEYFRTIRACKNACYYYVEDSELVLEDNQAQEIARIELSDVSIALEQYFSNTLNRLVRLKAVKK